MGPVASYKRTARHCPAYTRKPSTERKIFLANVVRREEVKHKVIFSACIQDSQEYGSDNEHMVSRVFFNLESDGKLVGTFFADLKQTVGDNFETGSIEVSAPYGYDGQFSQQKFSNCAAKYFRSAVGSTGRGIHLAGGAHVRMQNNHFVSQMVCEFTD
jgi:hypothetical protein